MWRTLVGDAHLAEDDSGQLQPVADAILPFMGDDFSALTDQQRGLF